MPPYFLQNICIAMSYEITIGTEASQPATHSLTHSRWPVKKKPTFGLRPGYKYPSLGRHTKPPSARGSAKRARLHFFFLYGRSPKIPISQMSQSHIYASSTARAIGYFICQGLVGGAPLLSLSLKKKKQADQRRVG